MGLPGDKRPLEQQMVGGAVGLLEHVQRLIQSCLKTDAQEEIHKAIVNLKNPTVIERNVLKNKVILERDAIGAITEWLTNEKCLAAEELGDGLRAVLVSRVRLHCKWWW